MHHTDEHINNLRMLNPLIFNLDRVFQFHFIENFFIVGNFLLFLHLIIHYLLIFFLFNYFLRLLNLNNFFCFCFLFLNFLQFLWEFFEFGLLFNQLHDWFLNLISDQFPQTLHKLSFLFYLIITAVIIVRLTHISWFAIFKLLIFTQLFRLLTVNFI